MKKILLLLIVILCIFSASAFAICSLPGSTGTLNLLDLGGTPVAKVHYSTQTTGTTLTTTYLIEENSNWDIHQFYAHGIGVTHATGAPYELTAHGVVFNVGDGFTSGCLGPLSIVSSANTYIGTPGIVGVQPVPEFSNIGIIASVAIVFLSLVVYNKKNLIRDRIEKNRGTFYSILIILIVSLSAFAFMNNETTITGHSIVEVPEDAILLNNHMLLSQPVLEFEILTNDMAFRASVPLAGDNQEYIIESIGIPIE